MIIVSGQSAAGNSVALPAHAPGDLLVIVAYRANIASPDTPPASGTVPAWAQIVEQGLTGISINCRRAIATASNHTSGTFPNAMQMAAVAFHSTVGSALGLGSNPSPNNGTSVSVTYPAMSLSDTSGRSMGVRVGLTAAASTAVSFPPGGGWTNLVAQPPPGSTVLAVHTRATMIADATSAGVGPNATATAFIALTFEITEAEPPPPPPPPDLRLDLVGDDLVHQDIALVSRRLSMARILADCVLREHEECTPTGAVIPVEFEP